MEPLLIASLKMRKCKLEGIKSPDHRRTVVGPLMPQPCAQTLNRKSKTATVVLTSQPGMKEAIRVTVRKKKKEKQPPTSGAWPSLEPALLVDTNHLREHPPQTRSL